MKTPFAQLLDFSPLVNWMPFHQRQALRDLEMGGATDLALLATRQFIAKRGAELAASLLELNALEAQLAFVPTDLPHLSALLGHIDRRITVEQLRELSAPDLLLVERWLFDLLTKPSNPTPEPSCVKELDAETRTMGSHEEVCGRQLLEGLGQPPALGEGH